MTDLLVDAFAADITPAVVNGTHVKDLAVHMIGLGWRRPTQKLAGEASLDFLRNMPERYVIMAYKTATLWRKVGGVWSLLQDGDSKAVTITNEELAFDAPFIIILEPTND